MDVTLIMPWLSLAVALIAILRFSDYKRQGAIMEGERLAKIKELEKDLMNAHNKIRDLEKETRCFDLDLAEVKNDIKHILSSITRIEKMMEDK